MRLLLKVFKTGTRDLLESRFVSAKDDDPDNALSQVLYILDDKRKFFILDFISGEKPSDVHCYPQAVVHGRAVNGELHIVRQLNTKDVSGISICGQLLEGLFISKVFFTGGCPDCSMEALNPDSYIPKDTIGTRERRVLQNSKQRYEERERVNIGWDD